MSFERIAARDLQAHDGNWRTHPQHQQDALRGVLDEVGIAGALLVYRSPAHDGAYVTIDGHLRTALDPAQTWPCLVLDVDDAEAALLLATHDPLAALAEADTDRLRALLDTVQSGDPAIQAMLSQLAENYGLIPQDSPENDATPTEHVSLAERFGVPPFSVLDARQGYWQARKQAWLALGIQSELGRGAVPGEGGATAIYRQGPSFKYANATPGGGTNARHEASA
jgi:hypothetical protein